jgi:hypothetical protein
MPARFIAFVAVPPVPLLRRLIRSRVKLSAALLLGLGLCGCAGFEAFKERLNLFGVKFGFERLDVARLVYPSDLLATSLGLLSRDKGLLAQFGVDIVCTLKASNPTAEKAVFDGVTARLRVQDLSESAPALAAPLPAFTVGPNSATDVAVTFPLRLDHPAFSKSTLKKIVAGEDIPYQIDADMSMDLVGPAVSGTIGNLGRQTVRLKAIKSSVNAKAAGSALLDRILQVIDQAL